MKHIKNQIYNAGVTEISGSVSAEFKPHVGQADKALKPKRFLR